MCFGLIAAGVILPNTVTSRFASRRFCMFTGCDYPRRWLAIQERRAIDEYRRLSQQAIGEFVQQAVGQRQAAA